MPFDPDDLNKKKGVGKDSDKPNNDDFINSSFAVQFKPGDTSNSVADKLKEGRNDTMDDFDSFKDEFDDFQIDDTIAAFKPIDDKGPAKSPFSSEAESQKAKPAPESKPEAAPAKKAEADIPAFPKDGGTFDRKPSDDISKGPDKTNTPVFGSDKNAAKTSAPQKKDEKLFNSGKDLDYATSEHDKNKSPFANASKPVAPKADKKPEVKTYGKVSSGVNAFGSANILDEIPEIGTDNNDAPSPFVVKSAPSAKPAAPKAPAAQAPKAPAAPAPHQAPAAAKAAQNEKHQAPATAKATQNEKHQAPATAKAQNEKTSQPHQAPAAAKAAQNEKHQAPATAKAQNEKASQPHQAPAAAKNEKPASAPAPHQAPAAAKAAQNEKSGQAAVAPAVAAATAAQRPGEAAKTHTPVLTRPAPTGAAIDSIRPEDPRRILAVEKSQSPKSSSTHERPNISPVDTVKKTRKKKSPKAVKDPGIGGLITLGVIIVAFIGILLILQNIDKISTVFGRKSVETLPTIQTTTSFVATETSVPAETTEVTTEVTTETTAETTTEATTETEETTTEATTAETTEETTQATSETTKKKAVTGIATKRFSTKVSNFRRVSGGFKYDIVMVNKSGKNASFKKSLKSFNISMLSDPAPRSMSSSYLKFTAKNGMWVGTPKTEIIFKPNAKLTITVTVKTGGTADYFAYRSYNFKYN